MTKFESRFFRALNEQDEPSMDRQAMSASLDKGTDPEAFDVNPVASDDNSDVASGHLAAAAEVTAQQHAEYVAQIQDWIGNLKQMYTYLNAPDGKSLLSVIAKAPANSILKKELGDKTSSIIKRAAKEIIILQSDLDSCINSKADPELEGV